MFFPGETVTHRFVIPFNANDIDHVVLSYKQNDIIVFEKTITSGFESEGTNLTSFSFTFTQSEGLSFFDNASFTIQCNVFTVSGSRHASYEIKGNNGVQYLREVMNSDR